MPKVSRHDDDTDEFLRTRGWFSRRRHGEQNGYRAGYDAWGWKGAYPGSITITCMGNDVYEIAWISAETGDAVIEEVTGAETLRDRAIELERHTDYVPN